MEETSEKEDTVFSGSGGVYVHFLHLKKKNKKKSMRILSLITSLKERVHDEQGIGLAN